MDSEESAPKPTTTLTIGGKLLSEALILAWVPVVAYFLTFSYQSAFLDRYSVPVTFVTVDGTSICTFFLNVLQNWYLLILLIAYVIRGFQPNRLFGLWSSGLLVMAYCYSGALSGIWFSRSQRFEIAGIIIFAGCDFLLAWLNANKDASPYILRLKGFRRYYTDAEFEPLNNEVGHMFLKLCGISLLAVYISSSLGAGHAVYAQYYLVSPTDPSKFLIQRDGEKAICGEYDIATKTVSKTFAVIPLADKEATVFSLQKIGPLNFQEP